MVPTGRRDRIGLAMLGGVVLAGVILVMAQRGDEAVGVRPDGVEAVTAESLSLDPSERRPRITTRPRVERPPVLPPVEVGGGVVVAIQSIHASPAFHEFFPQGGRRRATSQRAEELARPREMRQMVNITLAITDPAPAHERDHVVRIAGEVARDVGFAYLRGRRGPMVPAMAIVDPELHRVKVELAVPAGPLVEVERIAPGDAAPRRAPGAPTTAPWQIRSLGEDRGKLAVQLVSGEADDDAFADQSWLLHAVCHDGRVAQPIGFSRGGKEGARATINVPPQDVAYVVYHYRPYVWRTVGEVDIPPVAVEIVAKSPDAQLSADSMAEAARLYREYMTAATRATRPAGDRGPTLSIRADSATRPTTRPHR